MPTIRIDDEVWRYLKSKATPFEDTPNDVLKRELGIVPATASEPPKVNQSKDHITLKADRDYSYHAMKGYRFDGKWIACRSFAEMMGTLCSYLWLRHMDSFEKVALQLRGKKRPYFSKNSSDLRKPHRLAASQIFVETNLSATNIVAICRLLLQKLGRDPNSLQVE